MKTIHKNSGFIPFSISQDLMVLLLKEIDPSPGEPASQSGVFLSPLVSQERLTRTPARASAPLHRLLCHGRRHQWRRPSPLGVLMVPLDFPSVISEACFEVRGGRYLVKEGSQVPIASRCSCSLRAGLLSAAGPRNPRPGQSLHGGRQWGGVWRDCQVCDTLRE